MAIQNRTRFRGNQEDSSMCKSVLFPDIFLMDQGFPGMIQAIYLFDLTMFISMMAPASFALPNTGNVPGNNS